MSPGELSRVIWSCHGSGSVGLVGITWGCGLSRYLIRGFTWSTLGRTVAAVVAAVTRSNLALSELVFFRTSLRRRIVV